MKAEPFIPIPSIEQYLRDIHSLSDEGLNIPANEVRRHFRRIRRLAKLALDQHFPNTP
jgi:hypothetical protein